MYSDRFISLAQAHLYVLCPLSILSTYVHPRPSSITRLQGWKGFAGYKNGQVMTVVIIAVAAAVSVVVTVNSSSNTTASCGSGSGS